MERHRRGGGLTGGIRWNSFSTRCRRVVVEASDDCEGSEKPF